MDDQVPEGKKYATLLLRSEAGVDHLTLNRPHSLNAITNEMSDELLDYFAGLPARRETRIVVMRGAGRGFCAGLDLKQSESFSAKQMVGVSEGLVNHRRISEIITLMRRAPQAIVCLVHGPASGGGFGLVLAADIRIAGRSARMGCGFIRIGLAGTDIGLSYFLPRIVGAGIAAEIMMTGRTVDAERAGRIGLVSEVVDDDGLDVAAQACVDDLLRSSPLGLRLTKDCLNWSMDAASLDAVIAMEDRQQILVTQTEDVKEALAAFAAKRRPNYRDR